MLSTPKSLRLQIGIFGRANVGKSSFLNMVAGQDVSITSPVPGTTTDVVEKSMELLPVGPVVFLDTAGLDDTSELGDLRVQKSRSIFDRADIIILIVEPGTWTLYEDAVIKNASDRSVPVIVAVNKIDIADVPQEFMARVASMTEHHLCCASVGLSERDKYVEVLKEHLIALCPDNILNAPAIIGDLMPKEGLAVLIIPIDKEAPKGRIILPQVQTIRDALDHDQATLVVKENQYVSMLSRLNKKPDLVVCDSQVVDRMVRDTPADVPCTTFSILFTHYKADLVAATRGALAIGKLRPGERILIAESCSHHPIQDDIGRVKLPRWLREYVGGDLKIDTVAGRDWPQDLSPYKVIIQCGGCMITRRELLMRYQRAREQGIPMTNYGLAIAYVKGVLERVVAPFPAALNVLKGARA